VGEERQRHALQVVEHRGAQAMHHPLAGGVRLPGGAHPGHPAECGRPGGGGTEPDQQRHVPVRQRVVQHRPDQERCGGRGQGLHPTLATSPAIRHRCGSSNPITRRTSRASAISRVVRAVAAVFTP